MKAVRNISKDKKSSFATAYYIPVILICTFAALVMSWGYGCNFSD
jgi:hypothetical protein